MMAFGTGSLVLALATTLLCATMQAEACSCLERPLTDSIDFASVVMHANTTARSNETGLVDDVTYEVEVISLYKEEPGATYGETITFLTPAMESLCGIYLKIGEEYLLDLTRDGDDLRAVGLCGALQDWSSVSDEDLAVLQDGCGSSTGDGNSATAVLTTTDADDNDEPDAEGGVHDAIEGQGRFM